MKEACKTVSLISEVLESEFEVQAYQTFLTEQSLFKLMESANNMMIEHAHACVLSILYNTISARLIKNILKQAKKNKHQIVRLKCTEYMLIILQLHPKAVLEKYFAEI